MSRHTYLIGLGSNQRSVRWGDPRNNVRVAGDMVAQKLGTVMQRSAVIVSDPVGPSQRQYANGALILRSELAPLPMLDGLQQVEADMGRIRKGQRWRSRTIDLDIIMWSGGMFAVPSLIIPHPLFRERDFVLGPAASIAPNWRDPLTGLSLQQLAGRRFRVQPIR